MNFDDIGPLQVMVVAFGSDAEFEGLILDELERLTARGLIRVIDLQLVTKGADGQLEVVEFTSLDEDEAAEFGSVIQRLLGIAEGSGDTVIVLDEHAEQSFGLGPSDLVSIADELAAGESVGVLLFEHTWASELKAVVRGAGGLPIAQGLLTPEAMMMVGAEVEAIAEAEAAIELADAVAGAAMLEALATDQAAEDIKAQAAVEAVRALMVSGLLIDAAAAEAIDALVAAELVSEAATEAAAAAVTRQALETDEALSALIAAEDTT